MYIEDVAQKFAELLVKAADEHSAPIFAYDLALKGADPENLEVMAGRWEDIDFDPPGFADELRELAEEIRKEESQLV